MRRMVLKGLTAAALIAAMTAVTGVGAKAKSLTEMVKAGDTIKMGFSNEPPYAFPGNNGEPLGFVNVVGMAVLKRMGVKNMEPVVTEWGSLIPGLNAGRFDIITAGMYILPKRCKNVTFTEPMGVFGEAFLVKAGNPDDLHSFEDVRDKGLTLVTGAGYSTVGYARKVGIAEDKIMQVPDLAAALGALKAGRAQAISATVFAIKQLAEKGGDDVEIAKPFHAPDFAKGYSAFAFRQSDKDFADAFNTEMQKYLGTDEMMKAVEKYGYGETELPDGSVTTADLCKG
jgi:polar amino acid transport system substrate-binding protein